MIRKLILKLLGTKWYSWLLLQVIPFIRLSTYYTDMRGVHYHAGYKYLEPGDIILTVDRRKLTSLLVPGTMTHAALCVFKRKPYDVPKCEIAEMTHHDYTNSDFFDVCKEADRVVIMRCIDWDEEYTHEVIAACETLKTCKYDIEFSLGVSALYCSELIYQADQLAAYRVNEHPRLRVDLSDIHALGTKYISPDGLLFGKNLRCVWDSDNKFTNKIGQEIENEIYRG